MADLETLLAERFAQLPPVVQEAITGGKVTEKLRKLSETHKLHLDQWQILETQVKLTLLGIESATDLDKNIQEEVGLDATAAGALTNAIFSTVFEPIREELERGLDHPDAEVAKGTPVEDMTATILQNKSSDKPADAPIPEAKPASTVISVPVGEAYKPGQVSSERKDIDTDPYRENVV